MPMSGGAGGEAVRRLIILSLIGIIAFGIRTFSVLRYESVIHEFDPYFNYRTTRFLSKEGYMEFWNWFDEASWYPLGRVIGQTLFPGLMTTAYLLHATLRTLGIPLNIRDVCVFIAPTFAIFTSWATYGLTVEASGNRVAGYIAALLIAVSPSYLSRSTAGGFDNEAVAIFALVFAFYTFLRSVRRGTIASILLASAAYFYMVTVWGGYVFVTNTVALYMITLLLMDRFSTKAFNAYVGWYVIGTLWCFNIPFVNLGAIKSAEHMTSHGAFLFAMVWKLRQGLIGHYGSQAVRRATQLIFLSTLVAFGVIFAACTALGVTRFSGRSMTLLDPTYAAKHVPIIASISEHQPTVWSSFHVDMNHAFILVPVGVALALSGNKEYTWFLAVFGVLAAYFSAVMVRLMLVLAPASACLAGIAGATILESGIRQWNHTLGARSVIEMATPDGAEPVKEGPKKRFKNPMGCVKLAGLAGIGVVLYLCYANLTYGVWAAANYFSNPSIVVSMSLRDGTRLMIDDIREAFSWLRDNTHPNARILSWWDYGYQACFMANRTIIVDNNTWNNTHIANVGLVMSSPEEVAYPILEHMDVDYVFVVFGGTVRYQGDDINKFLWMVRIASGEYEFAPKEDDFLNAVGSYAVGRRASPALKNSLMYRLSFNGFASNPITKGYDRNRDEEVKDKIKELKHLEEAHTTQNWIVRIYKVKRRPERIPYGLPISRNVLYQDTGA